LLSGDVEWALFSFLFVKLSILLPRFFISSLSAFISSTIKKKSQSHLFVQQKKPL
jgi:hypothetical protein